MGACPYPGCEWQGDPRPYSRKRDNIPSVSTIAGMADDKAGGMAWVASGIAAYTANHTLEPWFRPSDDCTGEKGGFCKACHYCRGEFDRVWKKKAALGSHVHHLVADMSQGLEVESTDEVAGYLDAYDRFVVEHWPSYIHLERTVRCNGDLAYRGTVDAIVDLTVNGTREPWIIDWKTGSLHAFSQTLQLAGYRYADDLTRWEDGEETFDRKMMPVKHAGVVLLKSDGEFELVELPAGPKAYSAFMKLRAVWDFRREIEQ